MNFKQYRLDFPTPEDREEKGTLFVFCPECHDPENGVSLDGLTFIKDIPEDEMDVKCYGCGQKQNSILDDDYEY